MQCLDSSNAPAWVQAIGSILAILFAVAVAYWQTTRGEKERRREQGERELALSKACGRLSEQAQRQVHIACDALSQRERAIRPADRANYARLHDLDGLLAVITAMTVQPIPAEVLEVLLEVRQQCAATLTLVNLCLADNYVDVDSQTLLRHEIRATELKDRMTAEVDKIARRARVSKG